MDKYHIKHSKRMLGESLATILQISLFVTDFKDKSQNIIY